MTTKPLAIATSFLFSAAVLPAATNITLVQWGEDAGATDIVTSTQSVTTDTDYAGCYRTRKSTSGGIIQHGEHTIKTWSTSQSVVSLSSGEAEYYGMVRGAAQAIGIRSMLEDIGIKKTIVVKTDVSAAKGIASRKGMGRARHIEVNQLWMQDKVASREIKVVKIGTAQNAADNLTKYLSKEASRIISGSAIHGWKQEDTNTCQKLQRGSSCKQSLSTHLHVLVGKS